jgi:hypothetical protein
MREACSRLLALCRGDADRIAPWLEERDGRSLRMCLAVILVGGALFGGVVGWWRAPQQAMWTAIKLPILIFLTCGANALLNGMLAQLLGTGLTFRQTSLLILISFTIVALILATLTPVAIFVLANAPPLASAGRGTGHSVVLLMDVLFIAYAGVVANRRLLALLTHLCPTPGAARRVFWNWLAGNLFLGAQLSWILRPFIGSPRLAVQFLREDPFHGTFYGAVFRALRHLLLTPLL